MEGQFQVKSTEGQSLDIKELFFKYVRFLPYFILSLALTLFAAFLYLRYTTPVYNSEGALLIKSNSGEKGGGEDDRFSQLFVLDNSLNIQNEIELLRSRQLMEDVVKALNLNFTYYAVGKIGELHLYKNTPFIVDALELKDSLPFNFNIDFINDRDFHVNQGNKVYSFGQVFKTKAGVFKLVRNSSGSLSDQYRVEWKPVRMIASDLSSKIIVLPKGATNGMLVLSLESTHPRLAADVINQLMKEYQHATIDDKNETKRQTISFIDGRLSVVSRELDSVTRSLLNYQKENNLINSETQSQSYFTRIETYDQEMNTQRVQLSVAQMVENYLRDGKNAFSLVPSSLGLEDATLNTMVSAYNVAQMERKSLLDANIPASNAMVKQKEDQIERLRVNILESLHNVKKAYQASLTRLEQNNRDVRAQVQLLPLKEQNLLELKKQQEMKQSVYNFLMEKREETAISLAATISNIKVVEQASANLTPVSPNRKNIYIIAILAGLVIPALIIFVKEILNDKVQSRNDIEKITTVPIIGEVGHSQHKETLVVRPNNRGVVAEQFRIMRSNLQYILGNIQKPVIMVTSSFSGEGKSFVSTNLGAVLSLANKKTIILEFDIRKPKILSGLGITKKPGLTNYLLGKISLEELPMRVTEYENLYVLPCGPVPPNPSELLLDPRIKELFTYLKQNFDLVVIDTAPVGIVSDALTLSEYADATLYLVRQGHTFKKQINLIDEYYRNKKLPKVSIVLNDIKVISGYGYYGKGKYGYGYGYVYGNGNGYFDDETSSPTFFQRLFGRNGLKRTNNKQPKNIKV